MLPKRSLPIVLRVLVCTTFASVPTSVLAQAVHDPSTHYFSFTYSPFENLSQASAYFHLENFEDGSLNVPGASNVGGTVLLRSDDFSDSVDGDDGTIDNNGNTGGATCGALYSAGLSSVQLDFDAGPLGSLPTHVGLAVTDVFGNSNFELRAYRGGALLGSTLGSQVQEVVHVTQEDRFYGFVDAGGIDRVVVAAASSSDWAMDHLQYGRMPPGALVWSFCHPNEGPVMLCPCNNPPTESGRGCSRFGAPFGPPQGAKLRATGVASLTNDSLVLSVSGANNTALAIFMQSGTTSATGLPFGAGARCCTGTLKRLYYGNASAGAISRPTSGDPSIHVRSSALGDTLVDGSVRCYMSYYRDPQAAVPCSNAASTFNGTQALRITWTQ